ncbi:DUF3813 domain-containing protein [Bacillus sp. T33-2]|uniref:DUF3813 domain-containing protein n=1 Tax=Bacillus sp. T33-2 TaxID=2054168 RepID=UPI000C78C619|nr:DUF3813 domain-containing protein [Bacillus sp. T33-2]PLR97652.1 DUF3813 domain-containing protein [Bacillus sp. T33-2]
MANRLFREAKRFVEIAGEAEPVDQRKAVYRAKNSLSSAYANSTTAEKEQLRIYQNELDSLKKR